MCGIWGEALLVGSRKLATLLFYSLSLYHRINILPSKGMHPVHPLTALSSLNAARSFLFQCRAALLVKNNAECLMPGFISGI